MSIQNNSNRITTNLALIQNLQLEVDNIIAIIGDADLEQVLTNGNSAGSSDIDMSGNDILQVNSVGCVDSESNSTLNGFSLSFNKITEPNSAVLDGNGSLTLTDGGNGSFLNLNPDAGLSIYTIPSSDKNLILSIYDGLILNDTDTNSTLTSSSLTITDPSGNSTLTSNNLTINTIDVSNINGSPYPSVPDLQAVLTTGNTATELSINLTGSGNLGTSTSVISKGGVYTQEDDGAGFNKYGQLTNEELELSETHPVNPSRILTLGIDSLNHNSSNNFDIISNTGLILQSNNINLTGDGRLTLPNIAGGMKKLDYNPNNANLLLESDISGGGSNPMLTLNQMDTATGSATMKFFKNTATNGSNIGELSFQAKTAITPTSTREYARIGASIRNNATGNVDGSIQFNARINDVFTECMRINGASSQIDIFEPLDLNDKDIVSSTGDLELNSTASSGTGDINLTAKRNINLVNSSSTLNSINLVTSYIALHTSASDTGEVNILTDVFSFTGLNLESNSSGINSGLHLRIKLNGTFYKIRLENDA